MTREEIHQATASQGQPQLFIHWRSDEADCIVDLPYLREVHLFWAHHVDYVAICWDRVQEKASDPAVVAQAVDAWHRDYGLTWDSLIYDGQAGPLDQVHCIAGEALPQFVLVDGQGEVVFRRSGPFSPDEHIELRQLLRSVCSQ